MATAFPVQATRCQCGEHRPRRVDVRRGADRTTCLDCGCTLIRTLASRRWIYSGSLA